MEQSSHPPNSSRSVMTMISVTQRPAHISPREMVLRRGWSMQKCILYQPDCHLVLMCCQAIPITATGVCPNRLTCHKYNFQPGCVKHETVVKKDKAAKRFFHNRRHSAQPLPELITAEIESLLKLDSKKIRKSMQLW